MKLLACSLFLCWLTLPVLNLHAQQVHPVFTGKVVQPDESGQPQPLAGAGVYWQGTAIGAISGRQGEFRLPRTEETTRLVIAYTGAQRDTIETAGLDSVEITLRPAIDLETVEITARNKTTGISFLNPMKTEIISERELLKAACCNLSESFETSPSVDVAFSDAITGTRQIQMLGLAGPYTQITRENMPDVRGLSALYGLTYTPGPWVEGLQLNKGAGSVVNGFESIAGQINVELRKPESADRWYFNLYGNQMGRMEANINFAQKLGEKWSSALLLHGSDNRFPQNHNHDGFMDNPTGNTFIAINRWKYIGTNGLMFQAGVKGTSSRLIGGQMDFQLADKGSDQLWGMVLDNRKLEGWAKMGKVFPDKPWKSMAVQVSGGNHVQDSYFGLNKYKAEQQTAYVNLIYQGIFANTNHKFRTGTSFQYDQMNEQFNATTYDRTEIVPGAYFEYTLSLPSRFSMVSGIRADYHNLFGLFVTPRMHLRYALAENTILRASAGRGQRTASILAENNGFFASSREIVIQGNENNNPYGLDPEVAWNYGLSLTQNFRLDYRDGYFSLDFYRTDFRNQIVIDLDQSPQTVVFYNLEGVSFSNSFQAMAEYEVIKRLDVKMAYRWFDVKTTYQRGLLEKPLVSAHRAFANFAYETRQYLKFDFTVNWQGSKRLPFTETNPKRYQLPARSPSYFLLNGQISKVFREKLDVYAGVENLLNFRQHDVLIAAESPFSEYFDASVVWGPVFGRNIYGGIRYKIR
ncbi:MAG: TonB-dependent receptor [Bacteroidia bacterium]